LIGANLAVRTPLLEMAGGFTPDLQRVRDGVGSTEDHDLQERLWRRGLLGRYEPGMVVEAIVDRARLTRRYHRRWHYGHGRFISRMALPEIESYGGRRWLDVPLHLWRSSNIWFALGFARERLSGRLTAQGSIPGLVSIVIPCFNQREFLADAIGSALAQPHSEVIVIDDGSTDGSATVASKFPRVRLLRQPNRGLVAARNAGLRASLGEFVLFLDSDDRLRGDAIRRLRGALEASPAASFAFGRFTVIDTSGCPFPASPPVRRARDTYEALLRSNFICAPGTVLYRRQAVLDVGAFRPGDAAADYDMYLRLSRISPPVSVDAVVNEYRAHSTSMSSNAALMLRETLRTHARARRHLRSDEERRAWSDGRSYWREFYGAQVAEDIRRRWRARDFVSLSSRVLTLARYAPAVLRESLSGKLSRLPQPQRTRYTTKRPSS
jgi:glycosyltransferase involved in cell wall biosynthesis